MPSRHPTPHTPLGRAFAISRCSIRRVHGGFNHETDLMNLRVHTCCMPPCRMPLRMPLCMPRCMLSRHPAPRTPHTQLLSRPPTPTPLPPVPVAVAPPLWPLRVARSYAVSLFLASLCIVFSSRLLLHTPQFPDAWWRFALCGMLGLCNAVLFLQLAQYYTDCAPARPRTPLVARLAVDARRGVCRPLSPRSHHALTTLSPRSHHALTTLSPRSHHALTWSPRAPSRVRCSFTRCAWPS